MELRKPPTLASGQVGVSTRWHIVQLMAILLVAALVWLAQAPHPSGGDDGATTREVASKLRAAGLLDEAAHLYEQYLQEADEDPATHARIAYSLGETYLEAGRYEQALRWFYEAETVGPAPEDTGARIVHCLERLGRIHQAQATLSSRTALGPEPARHSVDDPVVARLGSREVFRSEVLRAMDEVPREVAKAFEGPDGKQQFLQRFVADELIWRKAQKLEYEKDPEVRRRLDLAHRRIAMDTFIEREIVGKVSVNEADLNTFFMAHQQHYRQPEAARVSLIKVATAQEAATVQAELGKGTSFEALAKEHSLVDTAAKWVSRGQDALGEGDAQAVTEVLFGVGANEEVLGPFEAGKNHYLVKVLERRDSQDLPFEEVRARVEQDYRLWKMQTAYEQLIQEELSADDVELFAEAMEEAQ